MIITQQKTLQYTLAVDPIVYIVLIIFGVTIGRVCIVSFELIGVELNGSKTIVAISYSPNYGLDSTKAQGVAIAFQDIQSAPRRRDICRDYAS